MARSVFISTQHADQMKAKGFNLMSYAENVDVEFRGRHLLDKVDSEDDAYIRRRVREQMDGTSVTVVLIGENTADSDWVAWEIQESIDRGNGLLGIRIDPEAEIPADLTTRGVEILDWNNPDDVHEFTNAIDRAALAARRAPLVASSAGGGCHR